MRYKSAIIWLSTIISALCIFFLSFTWKAGQLRDEAIKYATSKDGKFDPAKRLHFIDSLWKKPVYLGYTFQEVTNYALHKGLDLEGGLHAVLEVSPVEILRAISGRSNDPNFEKALAEAASQQATSTKPFNELFYDAFARIAPNQKLSSIFANSVNRGKIDYNSSDSEVKKVVDAEIDGAVDRVYKIIQARIDKFGVANPNIQRLPGSNRIQVELPGVDNPERARKLLSGAAKLEFIECFELNEYGSGLNAMAAIIAQEAKAKVAPAASAAPASKDTSSNSLGNALTQTPKKDSGKAKADTSNALTQLFVQMGNGIGVYRKDTARVNALFRRADVKALFPANLTFAWNAKGVEATNGDEILGLEALKKGEGQAAPLEGDVITDAAQDFDQAGKAEVSMSMNGTGARLWKNLTGANVGRRIAIVLDGYVYSAPVINGEIPGGRSSISGSFTVEEAKDLANVLKAGKLPAPTRIVEDAFIGPSLGNEAINQGYMSMAIGLLLVIIFMIGYYGNPGWMANLALLVNLFFIAGVLVQIQAALTLPGIAGIVLTLGMAVDANVLINERIREELHKGKGLKEAISLGYEKALSAIIDGNVTTILIGIILIIFGSGSVKGFGVTLCIGLVTSVFTAVYISHILIDWMANRAIKSGKEKEMTFETFISRDLFKGMNFDFIGKRKYSYWFSWGLIATGAIVLVMQGGFNLGVDFKGGRSYVVEFANPTEAGKVKDALKDDFAGKGVEVKTFNGDTKLKVTTSYLVEDESAEASLKVRAALENGLKEFASSSPKILSESKVGATIADDILTQSFISIAYAIIAIFIYILIRFRKWQYSLGGVIAMIHDVLVVLGMVGITRLFGFELEVDQIFIAAVLTVVGYSINDTVVVFDRIREEIGVDADLSNKQLMIKTINESINHTMSRTVMTATTVFLVVTVLLFLGGDILRGFSFAMFIGVVFGAYSSIFVAAPIVIDFGAKSKKK
ncbi:protein translocase subunit SecDF [Sandaracinomonas limnophila]|uniref:Multifunctional fusion protein n=1 Tax=Sandaracinomonas limnophila TaxID=1862386 RepID=A0A437PMY3_9BACT|nr:protein translocase subunit SecDF [Sandaracinomonas limnophila]RVU23632.1 protein translocase subunit SecDF [Sandaracinomonas limnophila]